MKRYIVAKVLAALMLIALATSAAGANTQTDTAPGGMGGLAGAGVGNY
jgi:hypothetical protein